MKNKFSHWASIILYSISAFADATNYFLHKEQVQKAYAHFVKDQCQQALSELKNINLKTELDSTEEMILAYKIKAICYWQRKDLESAKISIKELYLIEPNFKFDPFETPKEIIDLAAVEVKLIQEKSELLTNIKNNLEDSSKTIATIEVEKKMPFVSTLFPFGINHYLLAYPKKGTIYLIGQSIFLAANISTYWWKQSYLHTFGSHRLSPSKNANGFNTAQAWQYVSLAALGITYGISIVDAIINFEKLR